MSIDVAQIQQLNEKAKRLNEQRQRLLGQQEAARTSYEKAVAVYKQKYGRELDDTNLQAEYTEVKEQLKKDYDNLNQMVLAIESGSYKNEQQRGIEVTAQPVQAPTQSVQTAQPSQLVFGQPQEQVQPQVPQFETQPSAPTTPAQPEAQSAPRTVAVPLATQPSPASFGGEFGVATQTPASQVPTNNTSEEVDQQDPSEQPHTPPGWGTPGDQLNQKFENIIGGNNGGKFS